MGHARLMCHRSTSKKRKSCQNVALRNVFSVSSGSWKVQLLAEGGLVSMEVDTKSAVTLMCERNFLEEFPGVKCERTGKTDNLYQLFCFD